MNKNKLKNILIWTTAIIVAAMLIFGGSYAGIKGGLNDWLNPPAETEQSQE